VADELTLTMAFKYVKGNVTLQPTGKTAVSISVSGTNVLYHIQNVGTSEEAITLGDVTPGGQTYIENLDATNFFSLRQGTGTTNVLRWLAGEGSIFRFDSATTAPFAIADTAACDVLFVLLEN